ncbi:MULTISPECIES: DUF4247 domain-containing protein [Gordonia]|uniref:DUF4247 domain-containing protein n=1 Tax=Gordonia sputi NBRC 100414 TaxID=1089453 RepID=H5TZ15_9ACTN|nr:MULTISPECIES: DUF4247 domain-containing protein [Gordonia]NKY92473.1 DUF4247 domain-containing protein [Gordonia sputi]OBA33481.1 hypothetical protein A5766_11795 [Gordonia sp. 852002-51296_SCH5728562-b]GAB38723.1 hypothetical protein GOSPT_050_00040 [Gordonia sputi NBRC 100414]
MTYPPGGFLGPGGPNGPDPNGQRPPGSGNTDPARRLRFARNFIIALIVLVAAVVLGSYAVSALRGAATGDARAYVTSHYQRDSSLDESDVDAYVADGDPSTVAAQLTSAQNPTDQRAGDSASAGNVADTQFLQYPGYLIGLFPYATNKTKVMVSRDYRSGYNHYHSYVGGYWVPTPDFSGSGSSNRGGGSGTGK